MSENILEIRHLGKSFGTHEVLRDIDFTVKKGDVISIIGASGSGKSTLLRCVNLLETPSSVDLPEPEAPMMEITSPFLTVKSISRKTSWVPKDLPR